MGLKYELYNFIFDTARIAHQNTYDMRDEISLEILALYRRNWHESTDDMRENLHIRVFVCSIGKNLLAPSAKVQVAFFGRASDVNIKV